jgi:hypothetical protein
MGGTAMWMLSLICINWVLPTIMNRMEFRLYQPGHDERLVCSLSKRYASEQARLTRQVARQVCHTWARCYPRNAAQEHLGC